MTPTLSNAANNAEFIQRFRSSLLVFGSNLQGIHGAGAAKFAKVYRGAELGVGEGLTGSCYALPTKATPIDIETFELSQVAEHVAEFIHFAETRPELSFQVSAVGCGLAGFSAEQIAPLFAGAPENCWLPGLWEKMLRAPDIIRVIVAGGREFDNSEVVFSHLDAILGRALAEGRPVQVVSGRARGVDTLGEKWALAHARQLASLPYAPFPARWETFGTKAAGPVRNQEMSWYSTHLIAFWDGVTRGTKNMIETAQRDGLHVKVVAI